MSERHYSAATGACVILGMASAMGFDAFSGWLRIASVSVGVLAGVVAVTLYFVAGAGKGDDRG